MFSFLFYRDTLHSCGSCSDLHFRADKSPEFSLGRILCVWFHLQRPIHTYSLSLFGLVETVLSDESAYPSLLKTEKHNNWFEIKIHFPT